MTSDRPGILFVCVANSCRSQMAEAIAKSIGKDRWDIWSAGSHPSGRIHPVAIQAMQELQLDLASHHSKGLADVPARQWEYVVTMGCGDACPTVPARRRLDWQIPDPVGLPMEDVRKIREHLVQLVTELLARGPATP
jgi:protein-tyrosine-phosphatase